MLLVRFPNGQVVTYNNANQLSRKEHAWILTYKHGDKEDWICSIPLSAGCIVEAVAACKVENPLEKMSQAQALSYVADHIFELHDGRSLIKIKKALKKFNITKREWIS